MSSTLATLLQESRQMLGDTAQSPIFSDAQVTAWINQAIRELSLHFPRSAEDQIGTVAGQQVYELEATHLAVLSAEYDAGNQTPPLFLKRKLHTLANFYRTEGYYDFVKPADADTANPPLLYISTNPAQDGIVIALRLNVEHNPLSAAQDECTLPERLLPVLHQYVRWLAWQELAVKEGMYPSELATLIYSQEMNAGRAERSYRAALKEAQRAESESAALVWEGMDRFDRR